MSSDIDAVCKAPVDKRVGIIVIPVGAWLPVGSVVVIPFHFIFGGYPLKIFFNHIAIDILTEFDESAVPADCRAETESVIDLFNSHLILWNRLTVFIEHSHCTISFSQRIDFCIGLLFELIGKIRARYNKKTRYCKNRENEVT